MKFDHVTTASQLQQLCDQLVNAKTIAFDTEFVSEFTYRPDLCLIQVEFDGELAVIDTHAVKGADLFWQVLVEGDHQTICHAGREEFRFCYASTGKAPKKWFDVQLAAGMVGFEYPISYGKLLMRLFRKSLPKGETRTDWRVRPLSAAQMEYALEDVIDLPRLCDELSNRLKKLNRLEWLNQEMINWQANLIDSETREKWRKISGTSGLNPKVLKIVKEIWRWREAEAQRRDIPAKRVLRDDLVVELSKRGKADEKGVRAIRGMQRRDLTNHYSEIADAIRVGIESDPEPSQRNPRRDYPAQINVLGQFLGTALTSICRSQSIAPNMVGTVQDVRDLIAHHLKIKGADDSPKLSNGWRAEIVGQKIEQLLSGELSLRIEDPNSEAPLAFERSSE